MLPIQENMSMRDTNAIYHTDHLLRKHHLLVKQVGWGETAEMSVVDWETYRPASEERIAKWEAEAFHYESDAATS